MLYKSSEIILVDKVIIHSCQTLSISNENPSTALESTEHDASLVRKRPD